MASNPSFCACGSVVARFVANFGNILLRFWVLFFGLFDEFTEIFLEIRLGFFFFGFSMGFFVAFL